MSSKPVAGTVYYDFASNYYEVHIDGFKKPMYVTSQFMKAMQQDAPIRRSGTITVDGTVSEPEGIDTGPKAITQ